MCADTSDDRAARFVHLLAAHEHCLSSYVLAMVPNWNDAEEITQQTKVRLWEQFATYDPSKDFGVWACVIARYEVLTFRKRAARSPIHFSQAFVDCVSEELTQTSDDSDSRISFLDECLKKLTQWQQELLWRCCVDGDSTTAVAAQIGRKNDAVRKALLRVRCKLFRCIEAARRKEAD
jgi:RNA polymerase sigma-70 factor, ECF subfamily